MRILAVLIIVLTGSYALAGENKVSLNDNTTTTPRAAEIGQFESLAATTFTALYFSTPKTITRTKRTLGVSSLFLITDLLLRIKYSEKDYGTLVIDDFLVDGASKISDVFSAKKVRNEKPTFNLTIPKYELQVQTIK